jgi:hypothetical protein
VPLPGASEATPGCSSSGDLLMKISFNSISVLCGRLFAVITEGPEFAWNTNGACKNDKLPDLKMVYEKSKQSQSP